MQFFPQLKLLCELSPRVFKYIYTSELKYLILSLGFSEKKNLKSSWPRKVTLKCLNIRYIRCNKKAKDLDSSP